MKNAGDVGVVTDERALFTPEGVAGLGQWAPHLINGACCRELVGNGNVPSPSCLDQGSHDARETLRAAAEGDVEGVQTQRHKGGVVHGRRDGMGYGIA
jgi:hypothetical protein